jgi:hypothetical protein
VTVVLTARYCSSRLQSQEPSETPAEGVFTVYLELTARRSAPVGEARWSCLLADLGGGEGINGDIPWYWIQTLPQLVRRQAETWGMASVTKWEMKEGACMQ